MCGRYALGVRMAFMRRRLQEQGLQVDEAPSDDEVRETYNFAPGNFGAVYRADIYPSEHGEGQYENDDSGLHNTSRTQNRDGGKDEQTQSSSQLHYKIQSMKWGLVPSWTKRKPDYGSLMRTINCRDDSLVEDRGMWTSMKRKKRCVIVCQGFYEWLKKGPGGKEKVPHFVKRKDGELMLFAGLWDCVSYEGEDEKLYTYTIITTSSNSYLKFLHDRMPVILDPNSEAMKIWLDPTRTTWSKELQSVLKPYKGELECYPVPKEVGKVGNNSPDFIVPVSSKENKSNIANFFANAKKKTEPGVKVEGDGITDQNIVKNEDDPSPTKDSEWSEDNAPKPAAGIKRERTPEGTGEVADEEVKKPKTELRTPSPKKVTEHTPVSKRQTSPAGKKMRSATHNEKPIKKVNVKKADGSHPITKFFST
ncbi:DUF159 domain protein [Aspergillus flavus]|uniref:DUF159 domain protein n=1 Tax=Aspergillus flavus (strain ATCC 200026 / FGSC A1120 / IAM 13836 / NRRL 3357 / JCM 12722 / SRRC 167) TaxID=332952 RepID=A0A7U2QY32_ASPFN|nr:uncharacterized protein G4B84_000231 [Aspergillus flavus NRRL3357]QMW24986.1 hypothetical protein G4B84_000231 [Aspergillus flavus NRRL3357]QRD89096.1 DUF159 domain protein [Aspergillus flavus]